MITKEIVIRGMTVYVETDKDGYVSFSTDGYHPVFAKDQIQAVIDALRAAQTEDDREHEVALRSISRRGFRG